MTRSRHGALDAGVFRVLSALAEGGAPMARSALLRCAGEPHSVVAALEREHPEWLIEAGSRAGEKLAISAAGLEVLEAERERRRPTMGVEALAEAIASRAKGRPRVKRELDQVWLTPRSVARRALRLVEAGEPGRGLLFLGDDDLTSLALRLLGHDATVVDVDEELVAFLGAAGVDARVHDLREPLDRGLRGRFGAVLSDPPYAPEGFALFGSRAVEALAVDDARYWVAFGWSRRASERGLAKQRLLGDLGFVAEEVVPDFGEYEGAESLGARSALWICRRTPMARPLPGIGAGDLYTRRSPRRGPGKSGRGRGRA